MKEFEKPNTKISLIFVIDNFSCPQCFNEVVDMMKYVREKFSKQIRSSIWYARNDSNLVKRYHNAIDQDVEYEYGFFNKEYKLFFGTGNRLFFVDTKLSEIIGTSTIPAFVTPNSAKNKLFTELKSYLADNSSHLNLELNNK